MFTRRHSAHPDSKVMPSWMSSSVVKPAGSTLPAWAAVRSYVPAKRHEQACQHLLLSFAIALSANCQHSFIGR